MALFATFFHGEMSAFEITCVQSFIDHGHEITIYCYRDCGTPAHFKIADASLILPESRLFHYKDGFGKGSVSAFSNLFRYTLLSKSENVWWVDSDVVCLGEKWPDRRNASAAWQSTILVGSAVLYLSPPLAMELAERAAHLGENISWGQTGPDLLTSYLCETSHQNEILPASSFYPVPFDAWHMPFLAAQAAETERRCAPAFALHLWHEMTRDAGLDKNAAPNPKSFFGRLVSRHGTGRFFNQETSCNAANKAWRASQRRRLFNKLKAWTRATPSA